MTDLLNKFSNSLESKNYTIENNIENTLEKDSNTFIDNNFIEKLETSNNEEITAKAVENNNLGDETSNETTDESQEVSNCLALTVKKDYSLSVVKNVFIRTCKGIWKVAISIFTLNIIKFFF